MKIVFIHGRSQQRRSSEALKEEWMAALDEGIASARIEMPAVAEIEVPFYGDILDAYKDNTPLSADVNEKGGGIDAGLNSLEKEVLCEIEDRAKGLLDDGVKRKGIANKPWAQWLISKIDKHLTPASGLTIRVFLSDVSVYIRKPGVRDAIDAIVAPAIIKGADVIVAHSLGTVVAYSILRRLEASVKVPRLVTIGSPLGIRAIRDQFRPLVPLRGIGAWSNHYDKRDVVALYPLGLDDFPTGQTISDNDSVKNLTDNRHGIAGYLNDANVVRSMFA